MCSLGVVGVVLEREYVYWIWEGAVDVLSGVVVLGVVNFFWSSLGNGGDVVSLRLCCSWCDL